MKIAIGCDHAALYLKKEIYSHLLSKGYESEDLGTYTKKSCDYPDIAHKVGEKVVADQFDRGILICGTGIGMSISANKIKGIRAALCHDVYSASLASGHNDSNILCMGARVLGVGLALSIVDTWLTHNFEGGRHLRRVNKIEGDI